MAVALLAVTLKWAETRWIGAFFRLHTGPGGLACAVTPPPGQVWANSEHCQRTSRAGSNGLDRGSQVLGVRLNRYRHRLSHQRSTARLENCPSTPTSKAKGSPYVLCGYGAFYWQSGTSTFMLSLRIDEKCFSSLLPYLGPHQPFTLLQRPEIAAKLRIQCMDIKCGVLAKYDGH